jgi:ABC-2 type transport system ATP-binding protein
MKRHRSESDGAGEGAGPGEVAPVMSCQGLRKAFGDRVVVDDVGFRIARGETFGLLGPNGAGKTTTISMVMGLLSRDAGNIEIDGRPLDDDPLGARAVLGYVPQELAVYPDLTGGENLRFFARLYGLAGQALTERVDAALDAVGLADRAGDLVEDYSGGMKRRLNIAVGLLNRPRLLILDEPTVGVDPQSRNAILESVESLGAEGMGVLYTTHYMEEAERLCDRLAIMDGGRMIASGTVAELVETVGEHDQITLRASGRLGAAAERLEAVDDVVAVSTTDGAISIIVDRAGEHLPAIVAQCVAAGAQVDGVDISRPNLESVFLHLTGKTLRD